MGFCSGYEADRMAWMAVVDLITDGKKKELNAFYVDEFIYKIISIGLILPEICLYFLTRKKSWKLLPNTMNVYGRLKLLI